MANLSVGEIQKRAGRIETLLRKLANGESFETTRGQFAANQLYHYKKKVLIGVYSPNDKKQFDAAQKALNSAGVGDEFYIGVQFSKTHGVPLTQLVKNVEFGGKGSGGSLQAETVAIKQLQEAIDEAIKQNKGPIAVKAAGKVHKNIVGVEKTNGTPKSDFHLIDNTGAAVIWISHKDGRGPKDFQQWGGISQRSEPTIFNHHETQTFINDLKKFYPNGLPPATTLYRKIADKGLKMLSVYGNQYPSGRLGEQNVSVLLQGPPGVKKAGMQYELTANHVHYNGDSVDDGGFEPVLMAIYKGDRSDAGIKGTRIVISPIMGRKGTEWPSP
jgi:hypothetical protein